MEKEVKFVLQSEKNKQHEYFIKRIADYEEVWSLKDDEGWVTSGNDDTDYFPVWSKKAFAELQATGEWEHCHPEAIELDEFLDDWIDGLKDDGIRISVMWNEGKGIDVEWDTLKNDIETEMEKYC